MASTGNALMLSEYVGQRDRLAPLVAAIGASTITGRPLPHSLFLGPPGTGKTTLAKAVAEEMGVPFEVVHCPTIGDADQLSQAVLRAVGGILFLDEVHALRRIFSESLFTLTDEGTIVVQRPVIGQGWAYAWVDSAEDMPPGAIEPFGGAGMYYVPTQQHTGKTEPERVVVGELTVIGATTDEALLAPAFLSRLSRMVVRLRPYTIAELTEIATTHAATLDLALAEPAATLIAGRARQSPRRVKQLTERAGDIATVLHQERSIITLTDAKAACDASGVDEHGLEDPHRAILRALAESDGLSRTSLAQKMGLPTRNLELYWGSLSELGLVTIGRRHEITEAGRRAVA